MNVTKRGELELEVASICMQMSATASQHPNAHTTAPPCVCRVVMSSMLPKDSDSIRALGTLGPPQPVVALNAPAL